MYIQEFLRSRGVWFEGLLYQPASSSARRARNARIAGRRVAKAVLLRAGNSLLLAVLPASCRVDLVRFSQVAGLSAAEVRLATPDELLTTFADCEPGVVPAFGRLYGLTTLVDSGFSETSDIVVSGNTRHEGLWMHFRDFADLEDPSRGSFSRPIASGGQEERRRVG
jgi:Ala-tRNA(Pro) deacylase